jgi:hypothetical protein
MSKATATASGYKKRLRVSIAEGSDVERYAKKPRPSIHEAYGTMYLTTLDAESDEDSTSDYTCSDLSSIASDDGTMSLEERAELEQKLRELAEEASEDAFAPVGVNFLLYDSGYDGGPEYSSSGADSDGGNPPPVGVLR